MPLVVPPLLARKNASRPGDRQRRRDDGPRARRGVSRHRHRRGGARSGGHPACPPVHGPRRDPQPPRDHRGRSRNTSRPPRSATTSSSSTPTGPSTSLSIWRPRSSSRCCTRTSTPVAASRSTSSGFPETTDWCRRSLGRWPPQFAQVWVWPALHFNELVVGLSEPIPPSSLAQRLTALPDEHPGPPPARGRARVRRARHRRTRSPTTARPWNGSRIGPSSPTSPVADASTNACFPPLRSACNAACCTATSDAALECCARVHRSSQCLHRYDVFGSLTTFGGFAPIRRGDGLEGWGTASAPGFSVSPGALCENGRRARSHPAPASRRAAAASRSGPC